jgi:uncharacterized UBP type Zn finger protein
VTGVEQVTRYVVGADADGSRTDATCNHTAALEPVEPSTTRGCEDCLRTGGSWVHLRECLVCGHVGCCDNSPNKHATAHWESTVHPVMRSFEPDEAWAWCYADLLFLVPAKEA